MGRATNEKAAQNRERFALAYAAMGNVRQAADKAGIAYATARHFMMEDDVRTMIAAARRVAVEALQIDVNFVTAELYDLYMHEKAKHVAGPEIDNEQNPGDNLANVLKVLDRISEHVGYANKDQGGGGAGLFLGFLPGGRNANDENMAGRTESLPATEALPGRSDLSG